MLSFDRLTYKAQEALGKSQQIASENGQQQIEPLHLLKSLFVDAESIARSVCKKIGVNPEALHRTVAISSGCLDSLPHNGYVVTTIRAVCGETHGRAYGAVGALTVVVPLIGLAVAIALLELGFGL